MKMLPERITRLELIKRIVAQDKGHNAKDLHNKDSDSLIIIYYTNEQDVIVLEDDVKEMAMRYIPEQLLNYIDFLCTKYYRKDNKEVFKDLNNLYHSISGKNTKLMNRINFMKKEV